MEAINYTNLSHHHHHHHQMFLLHLQHNCTSLLQVVMMRSRLLYHQLLALVPTDTHAMPPRSYIQAIRWVAQ